MALDLASETGEHSIRLITRLGIAPARGTYSRGDTMKHWLEDILGYVTFFAVMCLGYVLYWTGVECKDRGKDADIEHENFFRD